MKQIRKKPIKKQQLHRRIKRHARLLVVPHRHNQYQPHLIRSGGIIAVILLVFAVQAFYNFSSTGSVLGGEANVTAQELLQQTNQERKKNKLDALHIDQQLSAAATLKADDMFKDDYWSHNSPSGETPWEWFKKADYKYDYAGENLAKSFTTTHGVIAAWMDSPEHRKNILNDKYKDVGFAVVPGQLEGEDTMLVVALYGTPKSSNPIATTANQPSVLAATNTSGPLITQLGSHLQQMTPAALASIIVLLLTACVGLVAHAYRKKLPRSVLLGWKRHHGLYKSAGMVSLAVMFIALYGGGQI